MNAHLRNIVTGDPIHCHAGILNRCINIHFSQAKRALAFALARCTCNVVLQGGLKYIARQSAGMDSDQTSILEVIPHRHPELPVNTCIPAEYSPSCTGSQG